MNRHKTSKSIGGLLRPLALFMIATLIFPADAAVYHVDPSKGNDANDGSLANPWRTIKKAKSAAVAGDLIELMPGDYGSVVFTGRNAAHSAQYITYRCNPRTPFAARFSSIVFNGAATFYIRIEGLNVESAGGEACVKLDGASHVQVIGCKAHGRTGGIGPSYANMLLKKAAHVLVEDCEIFYSGPQAHAIQLEECRNVVVRGCHVHDIVSSGIRTSGGANNTIEYNVVHDQRVDWNPSVHGSGLSIRSHDTVIRGNIVYNYGNTRPIRFYQDCAGPDGYRNMLVENNLVYKTPDFAGVQWWTEFIDLGPNCVLRNNTFIGDVVVILASKADGSGLSLYNNIVTGRLQVEQPHKWPNIRHGRNILGKLAAKGCGWMCFHADFAPGGGNVVGVNCAVGGFFRTGAVHYPYTGDYPYELHSLSTAVDFADEAQAPAVDLLCRDRVGPADVGCMECMDHRAAH